MKIAIDTSVLVGLYLPEDKYHSESMSLMNKVIDNSFESACTSILNIAEMGWVIERATEDEEYAVNCMLSVLEDLPLEILYLEWDFVKALAHYKANNSISLCDNATIVCASIKDGKAIFTREKEIIDKLHDLIGAEIVFLEDML